jgi:hypothetical protein
MIEDFAEFARSQQALAAWKAFPARHEGFTTLQLVDAAHAAFQSGFKCRLAN